MQSKLVEGDSLDALVTGMSAIPISKPSISLKPAVPHNVFLTQLNAMPRLLCAQPRRYQRF